MFPLRDSSTSRTGFAFFTYLLIITTVAVFFMQPTSEVELFAFLQQWAVVPRLIDWTRPDTLLPLITSVFLHANLFHLFSNVWFLHIYGDNVEHDLGPVAYLLFYLAGGIAAAVAQLAFTSATSEIPLLGASGAIAAVMGYYIARFPRNRITSLVLSFGYVSTVQLPATFVLLMWIGLQILNGFGSLGMEGGGVAWWAHIGGFVFGLGIGILRNAFGAHTLR
ncbi:MAG: rhomboid family intramembrane serine protease [Patescibacteria group bacterium]|nr:rhomboid family intramembrane serine protease [Patescibacteria group bacterium]